MKTILLFLFLFLFTSSNLFAQYYPFYSHPRYPAYYPAYYPVYYPVYRNPAYRKLTPSEIREKWYLQDEYKKRNKSESALDRKKRTLDQAERAYELNNREYDLISKGILPPKNPKSTVITVNGLNYSSYEEMSESEEYQNYIAAKRIEEKEKEKEDEIIKKYKKDRNNAFLRMWDDLSDSGKKQFGRLSYAEKESRIDEYYFDK